MCFLCLLGGIVSFDADLPVRRGDVHVDWLGAFLITAGLVLVIFVLGQGEIASGGWASPCTFLIAIASLSVRF